MEALECIKGRRSIRDFEDKPVDRALINEIIGAAAYAPSWKNTQVTRYLVIDDKAKIAEIAKDYTTCFSYNGNTIGKAPVLIAVTALKGRSGVEKDGSFTTKREGNWLMFDTGCATQTLCLAAYEKGLGTVIMGIFDDGLSAHLQIPEDRELVCLVCLGYPAVAPEAPKRKSVEELVTFAE